MHESLQGATFHIEHIVPQCEGGSSTLLNLALACPGCNLRKGRKMVAIDPSTRQEARLFHPVQQRWSENFRFIGVEIHGLTAVGRATVAALDLNHLRRQRIREVEGLFGLFPPV
jgi:hypothetical protein